MRVLVTGADGFVGQHLVRSLLERGHDVVGGITGPEPRLVTLPDDVARQVEWLPFDLLDRDSVARLVPSAEPDGIMHLAGVSSVSESWRRPEHTFQVNATGALHLLLAIRSLADPAAPRRVILVGSGEAYGRSGSDGRPLTEDTPLRPLNPYGASKAAQEMIASALAELPAIQLVQTRSFQQVGPGQRPSFVTVDWAQQLLAIRRDGAEPTLDVGNLDVTRDFLDVRDAVEAYLTLLESPVSGTYNVCSGTGVSLRHLLDVLQDVVGVRVEIRTDPDRLRPQDLPALVGDPGRLQADTGWRPRRDLSEALRDLSSFLETASTP